MNQPPVTRRGFLRGRPAAAAPLRPPWAIAESHPPPAFTDRCSRCGDCARHCPTRIIVPGDGGFPTLDFSRGECTFCADCVRACATGALHRAGPEAPPWRQSARIGAACLAGQQVECRVCGESCPSAAIRFQLQAGRVASPVLDPAACTGCGACLAPCPTQAITIVRPTDPS